ncbi:MAG TPA: hypothetical protein H9794_05775 [Candidatus Mediterraneibacter merdigallinarum]|nr:hypothetical protein [Candidatus Mediterraneibacter merdigallinarum]
MTKMRFSCPLCGAKQEADNMNERAVCPCCGVPVNMERSSEWRPIVAVYAPPDVMMRRSREREAEKNHVKDERECKYFKPASMFPLDGSPSSAPQSSENHENPEEKIAENSDTKGSRPYPFNYSGASSYIGNFGTMENSWKNPPATAEVYASPRIQEDRKPRRKGFFSLRRSRNKDEK